MKKDIIWVVTRVDGKIASVSADFRGLSRVTECVGKQPVESIA